MCIRLTLFALLPFVVALPVSAQVSAPRPPERLVMTASSGSACAINCLYVNAATGDDSRTKVQARNRATPWATIGRAAWGSTNRSSPNASEAAAAGDTVEVAGGTYTDNRTVNSDEFTTYYRPINTGTSGNFLSIVCVGDCRLQAPNLAAPIVGAGDDTGTTNNYIKWYADISQGHSWIIDSCADTFVGTCPSTSVKIKQDTGPVICRGTGIHLEGFVITSDSDAPSDNYNAIKGSGCINGTIQNNTISGFMLSNSPFDDGHASCFQFYQTRNTIVQHNDCRDSAAGVILKDNDAVGNTGGGNHFRLNLFRNVNSAFVVSHTTIGETPSFFYQNIIDGFRAGINLKVGASGDKIVNNTFYRGVEDAPGTFFVAGTGWVIWNNISLDSESAIAVESGGMYAPTTADHEHNVYFTFDQFFANESGSPGSFASWLSGTTGQDEDSPASLNSDPRLANRSGGDFRLCTGSGAPHASCAGASPALNRGVDTLDLDGDGSTADAVHAGAYATGSEVIGLNP